MLYIHIHIYIYIYIYIRWVFGHYITIARAPQRKLTVLTSLCHGASCIRYRNNETGSGAEPNEFGIPKPATPLKPQLPIIQCPTLGAIGADDPYISRLVGKLHRHAMHAWAAAQDLPVIQRAWTRLFSIMSSALPDVSLFICT